MTATAKASPPLDTSNWLTRRQASDLCGVTEGTLMRWERMGILHPQYAHKGVGGRMVTIYDPDELGRIPNKYRRAIIPNPPGEQAARAFELFDEGKSIREAVIDLREVPDKVFELYERWLDTGGADHVIGKTARAEIAKLLGGYSNVAGLVQALRERFATIEATVPEGASDAQIETAIGKALDAAGAPR